MYEDIDIERLKTQLRKDEGLKLTLYHLDGIPHIGYGHNIKDNPLPKFISLYLAEHGKITTEHAEYLLNLRLSVDIDSAKKVISHIGWTWLTPLRREIIINMVFNMGIGNFLKFKRLRLAINAKSLESCIEEMKDSDWFRDPLTHGRAEKLIKKFMEG